MRFAYWITKATDTHSEYLILISFRRQQWLRERASVSRYTYSFPSCFCLMRCRMRISVGHYWRFVTSIDGLCAPVVILREVKCLMTDDDDDDDACSTGQYGCCPQNVLAGRTDVRFLPIGIQCRRCPCWRLLVAIYMCLWSLSLSTDRGRAGMMQTADPKRTHKCATYKLGINCGFSRGWGLGDEWNFGYTKQPGTRHFKVIYTTACVRAACISV
jgi:hypothetical protein